jgi:hypothetical protein
MVWRIVVAAAVGLVVALVSLGLAGRWVWHAKSEELLTELAASAHEIRPSEFRLSQLERSPVPVREYLSQVLSAGQRAVESVRISHSGTFNMGTDDPQWRPFSSTQDVVVAEPGFLWNAHIRMAPGMPVRVHDAYVNGRAVLSARLFGLITVMEAPDSPELAQGELLRFLAEAPWYPTALLPGPNVAWESIDEDTARLTLVDGNTSVSLDVRFGDDGLIDSLYSDGRYRDVDGVQIRTPWEGRFWNYEERDGMLIPLDGEVAWLLPEGRRPYWRGHIDEITYEFADVTGASTAAVTLCAVVSLSGCGDRR